MTYMKALTLIAAALIAVQSWVARLNSHALRIAGMNMVSVKAKPPPGAGDAAAKGKKAQPAAAKAAAPAKSTGASKKK